MVALGAKKLVMWTKKCGKLCFALKNFGPAKRLINALYSHLEEPIQGFSLHLKKNDFMSIMDKLPLVYGTYTTHQ